MWKKLWEFGKRSHLHIWTTAAEFITMSSMMLASVLTARELGPQGRGELTLVLLWPQFCSAMISGSIEHAMVYYGVRDKSSIGALAYFGIIVSVVVGGIIAIAGYWISDHVLSPQNLVLAGLTQLYFLWTPLRLLGTTSTNLLRASFNLVVWNRLRVFQSIMLMTIMAFLWSWNMLTITTAVFAYMISQVTAIIPATLYLSRSFERLHPDYSLFKKVGMYSIKNAPSGWSAQINTDADQVLISIFLNETSLGLYRVAVNASNLVRMSTVGIQRLLLNEASVDDSMERRRKVIMKRYFLALGASLIFAVLFQIFAKPIISILFGEEFLACVPALRWLLIAAVILNCKTILQNGLRAMNRPGKTFYSEFAALIVTVICLTILIPIYGIVGAAIASLLAYATSHTIALFLVMK